MALSKQITLTSNFGDSVVFNNTYIKIQSLTGNKNEMRIDVAVHKNAEGQVIDRKYYLFTPDLNGKNFIAQAFEKTTVVDRIEVLADHTLP